MPYNITTLVELPNGKRTTIYVSQQPHPTLTVEELRKQTHIEFTKIIRQEAL